MYTHTYIPTHFCGIVLDVVYLHPRLFTTPIWSLEIIRLCTFVHAYIHS